MFFSLNIFADEQMVSNLEKPSIILVPAVSFFIPGFGSAIAGDYLNATKYFGYALTGLAIVQYTQIQIDDFNNNYSGRFHNLRDLQAMYNIGYRMVKHSMLLSNYDAFLNRVKAYQADGQYLFLPKEQNINSILQAPFKFEYLKRWTTIIPFALAMGVGVSEFNRNPRPSRFELRPIDGATSSYISYVAGTGEEAFFRGWVYPVLYQNTNSLLISNAVQGLGFGYAHGPEPYIQLLFGFYSGWLTSNNGFDLGESIFIHSWWDFWVITAEYVRSRSFTRNYNIQIPAINFTF